MPNFPIVDAHVHLYDVERLNYGWLAGVPAINRTYGLADFDAARGAHFMRLSYCGVLADIEAAARVLVALNQGDAHGA